MLFSHSSYSRYINELANRDVGANLLPAISINSETIIFPIEGIEAYVVFSLNRQNPMFYIADISNFKFNQLPTHFSKKLFTELGISYLENIEFIEVNNTLCVTLVSRDLFKEGKRMFLYFEIFGKTPNLYLCDENDIIIETFYLGDKKPGDHFEFSDSSHIPDGKLTFDNEYVKANFLNELNIRRQEKYHQPLLIVKKRIRITERKIKAIKEDVINANKAIEQIAIANEILSLGINLKDHLDSIELSSGTFKLDKKLTVYENVDKLFKASKKARETIKRSEENIKFAEDEHEACKSILEMIMAADEEQVDKFVQKAGLEIKHHQVEESIVNAPYKINLNGTIILFGKNAIQNDFLSFGMKLDREFTWLHIKDYSGAHIVIKNKKPAEKELKFAAELALIQSKKTAGEVIYTKKKNIRKGHTPGEAILKNYSLIKINFIDKDTIKFINENTVRVEIK